MVKRGRPAGTHNQLKKYDLYEIVNGKELFVCRSDKKVIQDKYGVCMANASYDIRNYKVKKGYLGKKYRLYFEGAKEEDKVLVEKTKFSGMPQHVKMVKCSSGVRFGG